MIPNFASSLSAARRERELGEIAAGEVVDVLVVGLGATGAGVALDAAARGLSVAAIDAHDLAFGTSRWSSKLIHGGLRYLATGQIGIAHESAAERAVLMEHTAPHLVRALPFVLPLTAQVTGRQAAISRVGYAAGDLLRASVGTSRGTLPRSRHLSVVETQRLAPALRSPALRGGLVSWDGQLTDDARLVVAIARTAASYGARILTRCRAEQLSGDGALVRDELTGDRLTIRARAVVNATGVWAGQLADGVRLRPSRGTHIVLRSDVLAGAANVGFHVVVPGRPPRFVLVIPLDGGRVIVGPTDEPVDGPIPDVPAPTESEVGYLLDALGSVLDTPVHRGDVVGAYAGLRPLLAGKAGRTADLSRRHAVFVSPDGVITIVGGKLTTYRRMAQDAVDAVIARLKASGFGPARPCRTDRIRLVGAAAPGVLASIAAPRRLIHRYGVEAPAVLALGAEDPSLLEPVAPDVPVTAAELVWAVRHEGALTEEDLLDRRTRIGLVAADRIAALPSARQALQLVTVSRVTFRRR
ncbi:MAG TPA: glycerol-3-phosphate dehydrogenase/oxidase [Jiangellaceae bacterium]